MKNTIRWMMASLALAATPALAQDPGASPDAPPAPAVPPDRTETLPVVPSPAAPQGENAAVQSVEANTAAEEDTDKHPVSGSVSLGYSFNHANFVGAESEDVNFGTRAGTLSTSVGYAFTDNLALSISMAVDKELSENYRRPALPGGLPSSTRYPTSAQDAAVGVSWSDFAKIPVADISFSTGLSFGLPLSKASQAAGLILGVSPDLTAAWSGGGVNLSLSGYYSYNFNEDPTAQIDCTRFPRNCQVSGRDLGSPNALHAFGGSFSASYKILDPLTVSAGYTMSSSITAVEFPDDELTSPLAQTGTQYGSAVHGTRFGLSYNVIGKTTVSAGMGTNRAIYDSRGTSVTVPLFDFDSDIHHRTTYSVSLSQGF